MENINIHKMIRERFSKLPPKLQEAITSTEVAEKLRALSQKYRLHLDQGQVLENETYMVLLGIEQAGEYKENLKKELEIPAETAKNIADDVAKEIFLSIRNVLKKSTAPTLKPKSEFANKTPSNATPTHGIHTATPAPISTPLQPTQTHAQSTINPPITTQNKLESIVKNQSKEIKINPTKKYTIDPYREPIS